MDFILILSIALAIDLVLGDPPTRFHPVGWVGKFISLMMRIAPESSVNAQIFYGSWIVMLGIGLFAFPAYIIPDQLDHLSPVAYLVSAGIIMKFTFSIKGLRSAALGVRERLLAHDLDGARLQTGMMVSRQTEELDESLVVAATVESVAENTSDGIVAPLFWFVVFGVPGAVAYRVVNTFDSMIGYHGEYEFLGKFAAMLDDVMNFIPARLTGIFLVAAAFIRRKNGFSALRIMWRDRSKTESINAGWPMSAAAGALGVALEKVEYYTLGDARNPLDADTITGAVKLMYLTVSIWIFICCIIAGVDYVLTS